MRETISVLVQSTGEVRELTCDWLEDEWFETPDDYNESRAAHFWAEEEEDFAEEIGREYYPAFHDWEQLRSMGNEIFRCGTEEWPLEKHDEDEGELYICPTGYVILPDLPETSPYADKTVYRNEEAAAYLARLKEEHQDNPDLENVQYIVYDDHEFDKWQFLFNDIERTFKYVKNIAIAKKMKGITRRVLRLILCYCPDNIGMGSWRDAKDIAAYIIRRYEKEFCY